MSERDTGALSHRNDAHSEANTQAPPAKWNRREVSSHLLPILKYRDALREGEQGQSLSAIHDEAMAALRRAPAAYAQLLRVYRRASDDVLDQWFGGIDCDDELLGDVFDYIGDILAPDGKDNTPTPPVRPDYSRDASFRALFRVTVQGKAVDLFAPFEEYYFCDASSCEDYRYRRVRLAETCKEMISCHLNFYVRACAWYRENIKPPCTDGQGLRPESHAAVALIEHLLARCDYERRLSEQREALEYERGGLGWFHRDRKYQIAAELREIALKELQLKLEDAREAYDAFCEPYLAREQVWQLELDRAPVTAFGRKKELKEKLADVRARMEAFRAKLQLDEMEEEVRRRKRGR